MSDAVGASLHDRETRGESLTARECAVLEAWYREKDAAEVASLAARRVAPQTGVPAELQETLVRIRDAAASIETLHRQNEALREEIAALQQRLVLRAA